jgi:hypothetical protein
MARKLLKWLQRLTLPSSSTTIEAKGRGDGKHRAIANRPVIQEIYRTVWLIALQNPFSPSLLFFQVRLTVSPGVPPLSIP